MNWKPTRVADRHRYNPEIARRTTRPLDLPRMLLQGSTQISELGKGTAADRCASWVLTNWRRYPAPHLASWEILVTFPIPVSH